MQMVRGAEPELPRRKAGNLYDRAFGDPYHGGAGRKDLAPGTPGTAASGGTAAGGNGTGLCRRLGGAVRQADASGAGADAGLGGGLLCSLCRRGGAGHTAPWRRGILPPQRLPALRRGGGGGGALGPGRAVFAGGSGRLRHPAGHGTVLCVWGRRAGAAAVQRGRRSAGSGNGAVPAAVPAGGPRHGDAADRSRWGGGAGRGPAVGLLPGGDGLCRGGSAALLPGKALCRPCGKCRHRGGAVCRRPGACSGGGGAQLRLLCGSGACSGGAYPHGGGVCRGLRWGNALGAASGKWLSDPFQCRGGGADGACPAPAVADTGPGRRSLSAPRTSSVFCRRHPAGSGGAEPCLSGADGKRRL